MQIWFLLVMGAGDVIGWGGAGLLSVWGVEGALLAGACGGWRVGGCGVVCCWVRCWVVRRW